MDYKKVIHLQGGIRAINSNVDEVILRPGLKNPGIKYSLPHPNFLFPSIIQLNLVPIGIDEYLSNDEIEGYRPPTWSPIHINYSDYFLTRKADETWSCIVTGAIEKDNYELADISRRITFEIRASSFRLRELSNAYWRELRALCEKNIFSPGKKIKTINSFFIYFAIHAFFIEICTLRDYLSEFLGIVFHEFSSDNTKKIRKITSLQKYILNTARDHKPLARELYEITDNQNSNGWLAKIGAYRNLIVHSVPIQQTHLGYLVQRTIAITNSENIPAIFFPIPTDPVSLKSLRSKGIKFNTFEDYISSLRQEEQASNLDALDYCCSVLEKMMDLAYRIAETSPIKPKRLDITDKDLLGPVKII
jgi:hypothetical protein